MALARPLRVTLAAWLGVLALGVQALVPLAIAVEIGLAAQAGADSVFELCVFGHVHAAAAQHASAPVGSDRDPSDAGHPGDGHPGDSPHGDGLGPSCPICVALHAGAAFTAPAAAALPLPSAIDEAAPAVIVERASPALVAAAYRSRAPPIG